MHPSSVKENTMMFGNLQWLLAEAAVIIVGIAGLDPIRKGWRGWGYYALAFLVIVLMRLVLMVAAAYLMKSHSG